MMPSKTVATSNVKDRLLRASMHKRGSSDCSTYKPVEAGKSKRSTFGDIAFPSIEQKTNSPIRDLDEHIYIPYQMIYKVEPIGKKHVSIHCKDFRTLHFSFRDSNSGISEFVQGLKVYLP